MAICLHTVNVTRLLSVAVCLHTVKGTEVVVCGSLFTYCNVVPRLLSVTVCLHDVKYTKVVVCGGLFTYCKAQQGGFCVYVGGGGAVYYYIRVYPRWLFAEVCLETRKYNSTRWLSVGVDLRP